MVKRSQQLGIYSYTSWIFRDPSYFEYIDRIGQQFFGLPQPQRPRGMFSGLMDSIFSAMNEDDSEDGGDDQQQNNSTASISMDSQDLD